MRKPVLPPVALPALLAVLLGACEGASWPGPGAASPTLAALPPAASPPARPGDALAGFAAASTIGATGVVEGQPARIARSYISANGRECREVVLGAGDNVRAVLACRDPDGVFASVRPLLRGAR